MNDFDVQIIQIMILMLQSDAFCEHTMQQCACGRTPLGKLTELSRPPSWFRRATSRWGGKGKGREGRNGKKEREKRGRVRRERQGGRRNGVEASWNRPALCDRLRSPEQNAEQLTE